MSPFTPRPGQQQVLQYVRHGGWMGVSAVPGSGKTHILSYLAVRLIAQGLEEGQEVLIVTFANASVDNFRERIRRFLGRPEEPFPLDYRVRTLHGLAHDIIRERPALLGLPDDFQIVDERGADRIREEVVERWLEANPDFLERAGEFLAPTLDPRTRRQVLRRHWPLLAQRIAERFIRRAKDLQQTPADLRQRLEARSDPLPLAQMGLEVYEVYQQRLARQGGVDFDDLIRLALTALQTDPALLDRLRRRWPYILEDEAQDSSALQERILRLLADHPRGNWVRVGDPNQAINTTFTTADLRYLLRFLEEPRVIRREMVHSGRSTPRIIALANRLMDWVVYEHPTPALRGEGAFRHQWIRPTPPGDPQPNPEDTPDLRVHLHAQGMTPEEEVEAVVRSLARWLPAHQEATVAVLVPSNERGFQLVEALRRRAIPCDELLRSTSATRQTVRLLQEVVAWLANPLSGVHLARAYAVWARQGEPPLEPEQERAVRQFLRRHRRPEAFLWPPAPDEGLERFPLAGQPSVQEHLAALRTTLRRWLEATVMPVDQLLLLLGQELFTEPDQMALVHKLARLLRTARPPYPGWRLTEVSEELARIARNERRFLGFSPEDLGYTPCPGRVTVATMHKAKGLEWDRVYLMGVNEYDFPSGRPGERYRGEPWYLREGLNLEAEALAQLEALVEERPYRPGEATRQARLDYAAERLRLLYVGITRARKELIITWNSGPRGENGPALALQALLEGWET